MVIFMEVKMITVEEVDKFINDLTERHLVLTIYELRQKLVEVLMNVSRDTWSISEKKCYNYFNEIISVNDKGIAIPEKAYSAKIQILKTELVCFCDPDYIESKIHLFKID